MPFCTVFILRLNDIKINLKIKILQHVNYIDIQTKESPQVQAHQL